MRAYYSPANDQHGKTPVSKMAKKMKKQKLPQIDSIEELAHFWDTHDLTEFEDVLEEVPEPVFERETAVTIHLQPDEARAVKKIAAQCKSG